ncbi:Target of rapamycin complex 2 subunit sin1 [Wickerhamiella sorbophila]|uniref:Target of rapamycin complex 2 subunit sin1 n=1 Tax=Wickerhamiella sorbophila TaxID=45607 RepID=A0A2T0FF65_9ASCO|nr:Target of rapamycin complex 2 subunit sin1 [Wickerhamiella sorbophila]PRT53607.1 Target of rapamycin complex 2 subunit sin1 [Wickerhamiella sorbophila]
MALLYDKDALLDRLKATFLVDQLVDQELVADSTPFPDFTNLPSDETAKQEGQVAKFFLKPDSSPNRTPSSSISSHRSAKYSPLSQPFEPQIDHDHSSHSDTDTDYDLNDTEFPELQLNNSNSASGDTPLYDLALEDDSDLEENIVLAAEQLKNTVLDGQNGTEGPHAHIRKSTSSNLALLSSRRPSKQRSIIGMPTEVGSVLTGSVMPVRRHSDFPLSGVPDIPQPTEEEQTRELEVERVSVDESSHATASLLSQQLQEQDGGATSLLKNYKAAAGSADGAELKFYIPSKTKKPITVKVRRDCPVNMALGYTLYSYVESGQEPKLTEEEYDANRWNVRLVEDDGMPDEDFPALDRVRSITLYSVDEFALVPATDEEFAANSQVTPNKFARNAQHVPSRSTNSAAEVPVSVYLYPYDPLLSQAIFDEVVDSKSTVQTVFDSVCKIRMLEHDMYVLRVGSTKRIISSSEPVAAIAGQPLEMTPRRALQRDEGILPSAVSPTKPLFKDARRRLSQRTTDDDDGLPANVLGYHHYKVWRRQQMKILGRQRRELAIDGEYIRIQPPEDRMVGENEKTTQFHIKRVGRVKQSSKVSTNFKILVYKDAGPKYYFLEGETPEITRDIVNRISSMMKRSGSSFVRS